MRSFKVIVLVTLISGTQCGLIDGIFGAVKDTTNAIQKDITGVVNYGKNAIFGEKKPPDSGVTQKREQSSFVDKISMKIHDVAAGVREHFRTAISVFDRDENGNGFIGRMFNKVKNHALNVKVMILGQQNHTGLDQSVYTTSKVQLLSEKLKAYVFRNNTTTKHGLLQTLNGLKDFIERIRVNITNHKENNTNTNGTGLRDDKENTDGTGLIDIRMSLDDLAGSISSSESDKLDLENGVYADFQKVEHDIIGFDKALNSTGVLKDSKAVLDEQSIRDELSAKVKDFSDDISQSFEGLTNRVGDVTTVASFTNAYSAVDKPDHS